MLDSHTRSILCQVRDEARRAGIQASLVLHREHSHLLRLGNSSVSLNTTETLTRLKVRVVEGLREATHTWLGEVSDASQVRDALDVAVRKAREAPERDFEPLLERVEETITQEDQVDPALAALDGVSKVAGYEAIMRALGSGYVYSGAWSSGVAETFIVATPTDHEAYHCCTDFQFSLVLKHPVEEWELRTDQTGWRAMDFRPERSVAEMQKLLPTYERAKGVRLEPGRYTVLLGPAALADVVGLALWTGFNGRIYEEKQGWTSGFGLGDQVCQTPLSIVDDPQDPDTFRYAFDMAGTPRRRFPLLEEGRLAGIMYDIETAAKYRKPLTGHTTQTPSIVLTGGSGPADPRSVLEGRERVLWIPAFHYTHVPNRSKGIFTGSSRFSAVVVERGEVVAPLFSSRVTDSFQTVFNHVAVMAKDRVSVNVSDTYGQRAAVAWSMPRYALVEELAITDSADSF